MNKNAALKVPASNDSSASQTRPAAPTRGRMLIGYFQPAEVVGYLKSVGADLDPSVAEALHGPAVRHIAGMGPRTEALVEPLAEHAHLAALQAEPTFAEHLAHAKSLRFAHVELRKLIACQPRVDWTHVERLLPQVPKVGDEEGLLKFCLPLQREALAPPFEAAFNPMTNTFGYVVDNPDVRICGPVQGGQPEAGRNLLGFSIGPGLHQASVVSFNGRFMLNNGYHRAVALAHAGHERIPVILVEVHALEQTPAVRHGMFGPAIVFGDAPPRIEDFLSPAAVELPTRKVRLLFSIHAEVHAVPG